MRLLGWLTIFILLHTTFSSSLLSKTINADGSKEFHIVKNIRHNTCNCQCRCIPDLDNHFLTSPPVKIVSTESIETEDQPTTNPNLPRTSISFEHEDLIQEEITKAISTTTPDSMPKILSGPEPIKKEDNAPDSKNLSSDVRKFLTTKTVPYTKETVKTTTLGGISTGTFTEISTNSVTPTENETSPLSTSTADKIFSISTNNNIENNTLSTQTSVTDSVHLITPTIKTYSSSNNVSITERKQFILYCTKQNIITVHNESLKEQLNKSSTIISISDFEKGGSILNIEALKKLKSNMKPHAEHNLDPKFTNKSLNTENSSMPVTVIKASKETDSQISTKLHKEEIIKPVEEMSTVYSFVTDSALYTTSPSLNNFSKLSSASSKTSTEFMDISTIVSTAFTSTTHKPENSSVDIEDKLSLEKTSLETNTTEQINEKSEDTTTMTITSDKVAEEWKTTKPKVSASEDSILEFSTSEIHEINHLNRTTLSLETTSGVPFILEGNTKVGENTTITSTIKPTTTIDVTITTPNFTELLISTSEPTVEIAKLSLTSTENKLITTEAYESTTVTTISEEKENTSDSKKSKPYVDRFSKQIDTEITKVEKIPAETTTLSSVGTTSTWYKVNAIGGFVTSLRDSSEEIEQKKKTTSMPTSTDSTKPFVTIIGNTTNGTELNVKMPLNENSIAPPALAFAIQNAKAQFKDIDSNNVHDSVTRTDVLTSLISGLIGGAHNVMEKTRRIINTAAPSDSTLLTVTPSSHEFIPLHVDKTEMRRAEQKRLLEESAEYEKRIREERIRLEQAKHLREEKMRIERLHEKEREEMLRKEILKRREEMQRQMEELRAAEERQHAQLEEQRKIEEERLRLIANKKAEVEFAEITSTTDYNLTKTERVRYKLRPSQCAAISKFTRVFKITDPSDWIAKNCLFAKKYFPQASCSQIRSLIESCFTFL
uniref:EGF-like domain-containing protein n=1 Tax=Heterorhabditis bacteriophora TaxID=37862 RepID=A0A1I7WSG0_HETBA